MERRWSIHCVAMVFFLGLTSLTGIVASAQDTGAGGLEIVELEGKLEAIAGNRIKLTTADGQDVVVLMSNDTTFNYTGTAEPNFLMPGLLVRFSAPFDSTGTPQAALTQLEVFRPAKVKRMSREMMQQVMQSQTPGIYPSAAEKQKTEKQKTEKQKDATGKKGQETTTPAPAGLQNYQVVGRLRQIQSDKIQVAAGNRPVIVSLAPDLSISVSSGDSMFCAQGDEVRMTGLKSPAGVIQAETVEIKGAKPLGATDAKPGARGSRAPRGKLGEKEEEKKPEGAPK